MITIAKSFRGSIEGRPARYITLVDTDNGNSVNVLQSDIMYCDSLQTVYDNNVRV